MASNSLEINEKHDGKELEQYGVWVKAGPEEIETEDTEPDFPLSDISETGIEHSMTDEEEELLGDLESELTIESPEELNFHDTEDNQSAETHDVFDMPLDFDDELPTSGNIETDTPIHAIEDQQMDSNKDTDSTVIELDELELDELELDELELDELELDELELDEPELDEPELDEPEPGEQNLKNFDSDNDAVIRNEKVSTENNDDSMSNPREFEDDLDINLDDDLLNTDFDETLDELDIDSFLNDDIQESVGKSTPKDPSLSDFDDDSLEEISIEDLDIESDSSDKSTEYNSPDNKKDIEFDLKETSKDFSTDFDETESIIEDLTSEEENYNDPDLSQAVNSPSSLSIRADGDLMSNPATEVLKKIENELLSIKNEILTMKKELSSLHSSPETPKTIKEQSGEPGFFNEDEDETIALTGDELDNILNTADITEELCDTTELTEGQTITSEEKTEELLSDEQLPEIIEEPSDEIILEEPDYDEPTLPETQKSDASLIDQPEILDDLSLEDKFNENEEAKVVVDLLQPDDTIDKKGNVDFPEEPDLIPEVPDDQNVETMQIPENADTDPELLGSLEVQTEEDSEMELFSEEPTLEIPDTELSDKEVFIEDLPELEEIGDEYEELENLPEDLENITDDSLKNSDVDLKVEEQSTDDDLIITPEEPNEPIESSAIGIEVPELQETNTVLDNISLDDVEEMDIDMQPDELQTPDIEPDGEPETSEPDVALTDADSAIPSHLQSEVISVLSYMDQLLESLPEEKIEEFANSEYFAVYKKLFDELGLH